MAMAEPSGPLAKDGTSSEPRWWFYLAIAALVTLYFYLWVLVPSILLVPPLGGAVAVGLAYYYRSANYYRRMATFSFGIAIASIAAPSVALSFNSKLASARIALAGSSSVVMVAFIVLTVYFVRLDYRLRQGKIAETRAGEKIAETRTEKIAEIRAGGRIAEIRAGGRIAEIRAGGKGKYIVGIGSGLTLLPLVLASRLIVKPIPIPVRAESPNPTAKIVELETEVRNVEITQQRQDCRWPLLPQHFVVSVLNDKREIITARLIVIARGYSKLIEEWAIGEAEIEVDVTSIYDESPSTVLHVKIPRMLPWERYEHHVVFCDVVPVLLNAAASTSTF